MPHLILERFAKLAIWDVTRPLDRSALHQMRRLALTTEVAGAPPARTEVSLQTTPTNFSGWRFWFSCPGCGSRVGCLYAPPGSNCFRCRHCWSLVYLCSARHRNRLYEAVIKPLRKQRTRGQANPTPEAEASGDGKER